MMRRQQTPNKTAVDILIVDGVVDGVVGGDGFVGVFGSVNMDLGASFALLFIFGPTSSISLGGVKGGG